MAELRTEIADLTTRIDSVALAIKREQLAIRTIHDALKKRAEMEIAGDYELKKLDALESRISSLEEGDVEGEAPAGKKASATTHGKAEHK